MATKQAVYDASAITALKGLEPVRRMPGMYTHTVHPLHIVQEAIDNAVDEALAGYGKKITVALRKDGSVEVTDEGRGVPVDMHPVEKKPAVEVAFTMLHAGGKFSRSGDGVYHISGGLHGVGVAVSNALSKRCEVVVFRNERKAHHRVRGRRAQDQAEEREDQGEANRHRGAPVAGSEVLRLAQHPGGGARAPGALEGLPAARAHHRSRGRRKGNQDLEVRARHGAVLRVPPRRTRAGGAAIHRGAVFPGKQHPRSRARRGRLVGDRLGRRRRGVRRQPRQPDPDALGRHARGRLPLRHLRGARRVHGPARARAQGREGDRRRPVAARLLHALGAHRAHAVPRPDQGEAHHAPRGAPARAVRARRLRAVAERASGGRHQDRRPRHRAGDGAARRRARRSSARSRAASPRCPASWSTARPAISRATNCSWSRATPPAARRRRRATRKRRRCCRCAARC